MKCDPSFECEFDLDGLPEGCAVHWNRLASEGRHCEDEVALELPNGIHVECGFDRTGGLFRVDVVVTKWDWHYIEHSWCRSAAEAAAEIVRLANKYMDDSLAAHARELSDRWMREQRESTHW